MRRETRKVVSGKFPIRAPASKPTGPPIPVSLQGKRWMLRGEKYRERFGFRFLQSTLAILAREGQMERGALSGYINWVLIRFSFRSFSYIITPQLSNQ